MDFGFIGFGSMAKMLIDGLINHSKIRPCSIYVTRNDKSRLKEISDTFAGVKIYDNNAEVVKNSQIVFLCVRPQEVINVLSEIRTSVHENTHIVSLAGTVTIENIQTIINCKITKLIPPITSQIGEGISLMCHNDHVKDCDLSLLEKYIGSFGKLKTVNENDIGFAAELTSCMPGFIASIFSHFANTASLHTSSFNRQEIGELMIQTLYATSKLLVETDMTFEQMISRVATKGGITQEGVLVFDNELPRIFEDVFRETLKKRQTVEAKINNDFKNL